MELVSLEFCEKVEYVQPKPIAFGKFDKLVVQTFPAPYGTKLVLATLKANQNLNSTDVVIMITVTHDDKEIFSHINRLLKVTVMKDRILPIEIGDLRKLSFKQAGGYDFNFYVEGVLVGSKTLLVRS